MIRTNITISSLAPIKDDIAPIRRSFTLDKNILKTIYDLCIFAKANKHMHDIEPYFRWREHYIASEDSESPYFGKQYSEFEFSSKIYNYYIHPQWDDIGSETIYLKVLFVEYDEGYAIIEMIGEWNDCIYNDIKFLKRNLIDVLIELRIDKFILCVENVLNFHGSDDCYYEEWYTEVSEEGGWIAVLNCLPHVEEEMRQSHLQHYLLLNPYLAQLEWRLHSPQHVYQLVDSNIMKSLQSASY